MRIKLRRQENICRIHRKNLTNLRVIFKNKEIKHTPGSLVNYTDKDTQALYTTKLRSSKKQIPENMIRDSNISLSKCKSLLKRHYKTLNCERNFRSLKKGEIDIQQINSRFITQRLFTRLLINSGHFYRGS